MPLIIGASEGPQRYTREHLIARGTAIFKLFPVLHERNTRPASAFCNEHVGTMPLGLKILIRDRIRLLRADQLSKRVRSEIVKIVAEDQGRFMIKGKKVWTNPIVGGGHRMWSLENPHHDFTRDDLDKRAELIDELVALTMEAIRIRWREAPHDEIEAVMRDRWIGC